MDAYLPIFLAMSGLYMGNEMRSRGLPKFAVACVALGISIASAMLLGLPKDIWRALIVVWLVVIVTATALMFIYYQPPADKT
ncbi:MAG: hypothetical protein EAZ30_02750 [Betaproteobacteria bacterium]|nr:MAG: hypothetical protein EAZ30_02750 [Betaproteobacteria bacterium]